MRIVIFLLLAFGAACAKAGSMGPVAEFSYGTSGLAYVDFAQGGDNSDGPVGGLIHDGRLLLFGTATTLTGQRAAVTRLLANGSIDTSFGTAGKVLLATGFGSGSAAFDLIALPDGRYIVGGNYNTEPGSASFVTRLTSSGVVDSSFGSNGYRQLIFGGSTSVLKSVPQADGKILALMSRLSTGVFCTLVVRLNLDGSTDQGYRSAGTTCLTSTTGSTSFLGRTLKLQSDGKAIVAGYASRPPSANVDYFAYRLLASGQADASFGSGGLVYIAFDRGANLTDVGTSLAIDSSNRAIVGGFFDNAQSVDLGVARLLPNGTLDDSFGSEGLASATFGIGTSAFSVNSLVFADNRILIGGSLSGAAITDPPNRGAMAMFNADGTLDTRFGAGGTWVLDGPPAVSTFYANNFTSDGEVLYLTGQATGVLSNNTDMVSVRLALPLFRAGFEAEFVPAP